jgi:hypothetical protein
MMFQLMMGMRGVLMGLEKSGTVGLCGLGKEKVGVRFFCMMYVGLGSR